MSADKDDPSNMDFKDMDFEIIYQTYHPILCRYLVAKELVKYPEEAEDIVSDLLLKLEEKKVRTRITGKLSAYLRQAACNKCKDYLDKEKVCGKYEDHMISEHNHDSWLYTIGDGEDDLLSRMIQEETDRARMKILKKMMKKLSKRSRLMIQMRKEGLSDQQIAENLNTSVNVIRVQISRAIAKLKELIRGENI